MFNRKITIAALVILVGLVGLSSAAKDSKSKQ